MNSRSDQSYPNPLTAGVFNYALKVEYDGTAFAGFQYQNLLPTVQGALEEKLAVILRRPLRVHCAGRTDAGVHALGQVISFRTDNEIPDANLFVRSLNGLLPESVAVRNLVSVPDPFHARFSCIAREYDYLFWNNPIRSVRYENRALWLRTPLPLDEINRQLNEITGSHDFVSFTRAEHKDTTTIRYLDFARLVRIEEPLGFESSLVALRVRGNAFLHNMIRILAGTIRDIAAGKIEKSLREIVDSKERVGAGQTAPPWALYFKNAYYEPLPGVDGLDSIANFPFKRQSPPLFPLNSVVGERAEEIVSGREVQL